MKYNWTEIQELYDSGLSQRMVCDKVGVSMSAILKATRRGSFKSRTPDDALRLAMDTNRHGKISEKSKEKLSKLAIKNGLGGYRPHPNKGQRKYGVWFDSKWEVAVADSLTDNNVEWIRPKVGFVWTDKGNKYYPDFYLPEFGVYLDPKNLYLQKKDKEKIDQVQLRNNIRVIVLSENELTWDSILPRILLEAP